MRIITETFADESISVMVNSPYVFALEFMDMAKTLGRMVEKENEVLAGGRENIIKIKFSIIKIIDKHTKIVVEVSIDGDNNAEKPLVITMYGFLRVAFRNSEGIINETFGEFYHKNLVPEMRKASKIKIKDIIKRLKENAALLAEKFSAEK
ncbi:MAG: hypothetical protein HZB66_01305 [Candidatus Aenigmarchaeota archaeon]|nr:hypothetical protein [Candidatus Aenigmarchaeota archaeon]